MKKNYGIWLFISSVLITSIGSVVKIMHVDVLPDILLGIGMVAFLVGLTLILMNIFSRNKQLS